MAHARVREPSRHGQVVSFTLTDDSLPEDHPARLLWTLLGECDLRPFYRDAKAVQLKLDELIRATKGAHTVLLDLEELSDSELTKIRDKYEKIASEARKRIRSGSSDTDIPDILMEDWPGN